MTDLCLTVLNPWPAYIFLPEDDPWKKRVENRCWNTSHRGDLLIHAGSSKRMMTPETSEIGLDFVYSAIIGVVSILDCVRIEQLSNGTNRVPPAAAELYPWLAFHRHAHGEYCWILGNVRKFRQPIRCRGYQRIFRVPPYVMDKVNRAEAIAL
jgi:hypothetical protein